MNLLVTSGCGFIASHVLDQPYVVLAAAENCSNR